MANDRLSESHGQKQTVRSAMHRGGLLDWLNPIFMSLTINS